MPRLLESIRRYSPEAVALHRGNGSCVHLVWTSLRVLDYSAHYSSACVIDAKGAFANLANQFHTLLVEAASNRPLLSVLGVPSWCSLLVLPLGSFSSGTLFSPEHFLGAQKNFLKLFRRRCFRRIDFQLPKLQGTPLTLRLLWQIRRGDSSTTFNSLF